MFAHMKYLLLLLSSLMALCANAQNNVSQKVDAAAKALLSDPQIKHAIVGLYIVNSATGEVVYNLNGGIGLAPASTQKVITSTAAFDMLGEKFRYATILGYDGKIDNGVLNGNVYLVGQCDPTFGSWRYPSTKRDVILKRITTALQQKGIQSINGNIIIDDSKFSFQSTPGGWIWDDIGNYYGAGAWALNWNENQYDLKLKPGAKEGDNVEIISTTPTLQAAVLQNKLKTGKPGSGDNAYIYLPPYSGSGFVEGTVPAGESSFTISGAMPNPAFQVAAELQQALEKQSITVSGNVQTLSAMGKKGAAAYTGVLDTIYSPTLDSVVYWFLQKSINLYGEALMKTMAAQKGKTGSTEDGVALVRQFWSERGVEKSAFKMMDGSGLSPQNRVTTEGMVTVLQYAKDKPWYNAFYNGLPLYNGMKMKSGTIGGSKAFAGYHTSKTGVGYTFAIIINNFDGSASSVVQKMYKVLDELK